MKAVRWTVAVLIFVGALLAIAYVLVPSRVESRIGSSIEAYAAAAAGTAADVQSVSLSLAQRRSDIGGLTVDNPSGYEAEHVLEIDTIGVEVDVGSLAGSTLVVDEIAVAGARLHAEQAGAASNLTDILRHMRDTEEQASAEPTDSRIVIRRFELGDARMILRSQELDEPEEIMLEPVVLTDLGRPGDGLTYGEATDAILGAILTAGREAVTARVGEAATDAVKREVEDAVGERIRELDE